MAGGSLGGDEDGGIVGINVTPLVDIMLVLLIIFMVASTYIVKESIEVDLPKAATGGETLDTTLSLILKTGGQIYLNGESITPDKLAAECRRQSAKDPKIQAMIAADKTTPHGEVVELIDLIRQNGVVTFAINIDPKAADPLPPSPSGEEAAEEALVPEGEGSE
ncbi:biopolymer transporter ExbD [Myxococcota bacterium]|nr:biopolymer transporter ExbD [Myxococcota bacterium]MBU1430642.1 biopolymer transporter ExbD [Myxococcota bacterium]MBU1898414.1 biopolymer transporter ExbD [Myxococcota bacterium]